MIKTYPSIDGTEPKCIYAVGVPRSNSGDDFNGVEEYQTHQMRAVYQFDGCAVNLFPAFEEQDNAEWVPEWTVEVSEGVLDAYAAVGNFDTPDAAVSHVRESLTNW